MGGDEDRHPDRHVLDRPQPRGCRGVLGGGHGGGPKSAEQGDPSAFGEVDPETGLARWYDEDQQEVAGYDWQDIFGHWPLVESDLHEFYGVDLGAPGILDNRSWHWLRTRIEGLLSRPPMVAGHKQDGSPVLIQTTRIALQLSPSA
ncbi:hypothetical protein CGZ93_17920 [Enemella dayhoffiae]|uniref:Uncharacterized protein n=1 Tax=Enemella dayhoffiae TaxID=2016507 RepID=A0A255GLC9_9ACTN|nr:hypothetical protein CGZ93_17920 [Enemella dayhoffiae]